MTVNEKVRFQITDNFYLLMMSYLANDVGLSATLLGKYWIPIYFSYSAQKYALPGLTGRQNSMGPSFSDASCCVHQQGKAQADTQGGVWGN